MGYKIVGFTMLSSHMPIMCFFHTTHYTLLFLPHQFLFMAFRASGMELKVLHITNKHCAMNLCSHPFPGLVSRTLYLILVRVVIWPICHPSSHCYQPSPNQWSLHKLYHRPVRSLCSIVGVILIIINAIIFITTSIITL